MSCEQVSAFDEAVTAKDAEIGSLKARIAELEEPCTDPVAHSPHTRGSEPSERDARGHPVSMPYPSPHSGHGVLRASLARTTPCRGNATPVSEFTGDDPDCTLEDWLPSLERAIVWNAWTEEEQIIELAGHLKSRALQEWNLLKPGDKASFTEAVEALRFRLDCGGKALAAQDFRHAIQHDGELVSDFVRRLEHTFRAVYGQELISAETKDMLFYGQLQEGLHLQLMRAPAVLGAKNYQELILAAKNEDRRLADLKRRQEYARSAPQSASSRQKNSVQHSFKSRPSHIGSTSQLNRQSASDPQTKSSAKRKCFHCKRPGHLLHQCPLHRRKGNGSQPRRKDSSAKQVVTEPTLQHRSDVPLSCSEVAQMPNPGETPYAHKVPQEDSVTPLSLFFSESEDEGDVKRVMVTDHGSRPQLARMDIQGVPADGVVDTAADITIMGGKLFALVASSARLRKKDFKPPD